MPARRPAPGRPRPVPDRARAPPASWSPAGWRRWPPSWPAASPTATPCQVCGSTAHPAPAAPAHDAVDAGRPGGRRGRGWRRQRARSRPRRPALRDAEHRRADLRGRPPRAVRPRRRTPRSAPWSRRWRHPQRPSRSVARRGAHLARAELTGLTGRQAEAATVMIAGLRRPSRPTRTPSAPSPSSWRPRARPTRASGPSSTSSPGRQTSSSTPPRSSPPPSGPRPAPRSCTPSARGPWRSRASTRSRERGRRRPRPERTAHLSSCVTSIAELAEDGTVEGVYAVGRKERRRTKAGAPYLALELVDASAVASRPGSGTMSSCSTAASRKATPSACSVGWSGSAAGCRCRSAPSRWRRRATLPS